MKRVKAHQIEGLGSLVAGGLVAFARAKRTAGNVTLNSTTWTNIDTALDLTIAASAGDVIEAYMGVAAGGGGATYWCVLDFHTIVAGAPVNSIGHDGAASSTSASHGAWASPGVPPDTNGGGHFTGHKRYTVQAGDISGGTVTLRLRGRSGNPITLKAGGDPALYVEVTNLGPQL